MTIAGELVSILGYRIEGQDELKRYDASLDKASDSAKRHTERINALRTAIGIGVAAATTFGVAAVKNFAGFEREMGRIGVTAGATIEQTVKAGEKVQQFSKQFALPIEEAVSGLDVLTAAGLNLDDAMAFLPSVLATAQASGSAVSDVANTALKASSALQIEAKDMQRAFDIMVVGGKAGQFELKDMAQYIPDLANSFASMGYKGEDGLKRLIAVLQTLREDTGTASSAATQAQNIFGKIYSQETSKKFEKLFDVDLEKEMAAAQAKGEDALTAFIGITKRAINGDLTLLPKLFEDTEFRLGMQSLLTSQDSFEKFMGAVNDAKVEGTVFQDLKRFTDDTTASIQNMSSAWDSFMKSVGGAAAPTVTDVLNKFTREISYQDAASKALQERGWGRFTSGLWMGSKEEKDQLAREGGWIDPKDPNAAKVAKEAPRQYQVLGRRISHPGQQDLTQPEERATKEGNLSLRPEQVTPVIEVRPTETEEISLRPEQKSPVLELLDKDVLTEFERSAEKMLSANDQRALDLYRRFDQAQTGMSNGNGQPEVLHKIKGIDGKVGALDIDVGDIQARAGDDEIRSGALRNVSAVEAKLGVLQSGVDELKASIALPLPTTASESVDTAYAQPRYTPSQQIQMDQATRSSEAGYGRTTDTLPGKLKDDFGTGQVASMLASMNANLAKMSGDAMAKSVSATITDARSDNRDQSVSVSVGGVVVQGVQNVNAAVGGAVGTAVGNSAARGAQSGRPARLEMSGAF